MRIRSIGVWMRQLGIALVCLAMPSPVLGEAIPQEQEIHATYKVGVASIDLGTFKMTATVGPEAYALKAKGEFSILGGLLYRAKGETRSNGTRVNATSKPQRFDFSYSDNKKKQQLQIVFDNGTVRTVTRTPKKRPDKKAVPLSDDQLRNVLDPMTAAFLSVQARSPAGDLAVCDGTLRVFDGKRLFELTFSPKRTEQLGCHQAEIIALYGQEIDRLRAFFGRNGFNEKFLNAPIEIDYTPIYLKSVRGSASFAAAFSRDPQEESYFYISSHFPRHGSEETDNPLQRRLNREYKMLTAHETIPGHHFLDSIRRSLKNPIRRQIESPLFYEGWASYAESMLIEYGYLDDPLELLVSLKRNLWRSARCQIDVGLTLGKLTEKDALNLLKQCGFASQEASRQLDRFRLNPGYQLCYCYGSSEFKQLKQKYGHCLEGKDFHSFVLEGGEIPFHLIARRFENLSQTPKYS